MLAKPTFRLPISIRNSSPFCCRLSADSAISSIVVQLLNKFSDNCILFVLKMSPAYHKGWVPSMRRTLDRVRLILNQEIPEEILKEFKVNLQ